MKNINKKNTGTNLKINTVTSLLMQITTIISGLVLPRLLLSTFGSDVNGLTSSISQFLNFFSVLEGGISGVVLAALYGPVAAKDDYRISEVVCAANKFLKKLGIGFLIYTAILTAIYPFTNSIFSWPFSASLVVILSIGTFIQYYFSIVPQLIVRADNKVYVYNLVGILFNVFNVVLTILCIHVCPEIHIVKFVSALVFLIQPIVLNAYVKKHFEIDKNCESDEGVIKNRWSGFGINLANIITTNTDVIVLTLLSTLKTVSIYTIYYSIANALKSILMSFGYGYQSILGQKVAQHDTKKMNYYFEQYEFVTYNISGVAFSCCICLIVPFVMIYTDGVTDTNYRQILFAILICLALYILCVREPYIQATYTAGLFKETQKFAFAEAIINIVVSIVFVKTLGLVGVAIGTVVSAAYRYISTVFFLKSHVLNRPVSSTVRKQILYMIPFIALCVAGRSIMGSDLSIVQWIIRSLMMMAISISSHLLIDFIFFRKQLAAFTKVRNP